MIINVNGMRCEDCKCLKSNGKCFMCSYDSYPISEYSYNIFLKKTSYFNKGWHVCEECLIKYSIEDFINKIEAKKQYSNTPEEIINYFIEIKAMYYKTKDIIILYEDGIKVHEENILKLKKGIEALKDGTYYKK